ncbi:MAG: hemolysin family protein [Rickettsiales bacterium]
MNGDSVLDSVEGGANETSESPRQSGFFRNLFRGMRNGRNGDSSLRETFEELIEQHEENEPPVDPVARAMLDKVLTVGALTVADVMIPRADIVAVDVTISRSDLLTLIAEEAHSLMPVYRGNLDDVLGMIHIKDLMASMASEDPFDIGKILRKTLFVAPSMRVLDLLLQMRMDRTHMALVVDEFGGIDGLTTIEDLVEQIVGEIEDEHDVDEGPLLTARPDGSLDIDARLSLGEFETTVGKILTDEEREEGSDTVGGLIFNLAGRVPTRGEVILHEESGVEFEIIDADARRIRRVRVCSLPPQDDLDST